MTLTIESEAEAQVLRAAVHDWVRAQERIPQEARQVQLGRKLLRKIPAPTGRGPTPRTRNS